MPDCHEFDNWNEHMPYQVGESAVTHFQRNHAEAATGHPATDFDTYSYWQMCGGRYGDGEATSPAASSGSPPSPPPGNFPPFGAWLSLTATRNRPPLDATSSIS